MLTSNRLRIRLIYFAYCKVGGAQDIIRHIWNFGKLVIVSEQDRRDLPNIPLHGPPVKDCGRPHTHKAERRVL